MHAHTQTQPCTPSTCTHRCSLTHISTPLTQLWEQVCVCMHQHTHTHTSVHARAHMHAYTHPTEALEGWLHYLAPKTPFKQMWSGTLLVLIIHKVHSHTTLNSPHRTLLYNQPLPPTSNQLPHWVNMIHTLNKAILFNCFLVLSHLLGTQE